jgi:hypothetical protein
MPTIIKKRSTQLTLAAIVVVGIALWFFLAARTNDAFAETYRAYDLAADQHTNAAYVPAADANPLRQRLNRLLAEVLSEDTSESARLESARAGLTVAKEVEKQIDTIGDFKETIAISIANMQETADSLSSIGNTDMQDVIDLANERSVIIDDIRGLSYRANFEVHKIFERIIADGGVLTAAHITALNRSLPELEEQFDTRTELYTQLQSTSQKLDTAFAKMSGE